MKLFSGFPDGKLAVTPLPNLFFSELAPLIDDLAELKLTCHLFWLAAHPRTAATGAARRRTYVTDRELRGDPTLMRSLAALGEPEPVLAGALARATERGTLLRISVATVDPDGQVLYLLNTQTGRHECERLERELPPGESLSQSEPVDVITRPTIFSLYEQNIGLLTPMMAEMLKDAEREYAADWIEDAFRAAVKKNARNWSYIESILKRWQKEGRTARAEKRKHWWNDEYDEFVRR